MRPLLLALTLLTIAPLAAAETVAAPLTDLTIRSYRHSLSPRTFDEARDVAAAILAHSGIRVVWITCWPVADADCARPLGSNELIARFAVADDANARRQAGSLGFSMIDGSRRPATVATVYVDRVERLARDVRVNAALILGRALAHEIGHTLMGTTRHAGGGLMRAVWSRAELRGGTDTDWQFSDEECGELRIALATRGTTASAGE